jgi:SAM-dependent methyltransferase
MVDDVISRLLDNSLIHTACPLCQSSSIYSTGSIPYGKGLFYASTPIKLKNTSELFRCRGCGSGFVQSAVTQAEAEVLYRLSDSGKRWKATGSFEEAKTTAVLGAMRKIFSNSRTVLDAGCNTGELLDYAAGFGCRTYGIEPSPASASICRDKGHIIMDDLATVGLRFDVITAFDLIEHLYDINGFLRRCAALLSESGKLVVLTGNIDSRPARLAGRRWWYSACPEHIVFPSMQYMAELRDWDIVLSLPCYNAKSWLFPFTRTAIQTFSGLLLNRYSGYPSFWPDHMLLILSPKKNS